MILKINDTDFSKFITGYEISDDEDIVLSEIQMAQGTKKIKVAPYTLTEIEVEFGFMTEARYQTLLSALTNSAGSVVEYYSPKTGETKKAVFYAELPRISVVKKNPGLTYYKQISLKLIKVGEVTA